LARFALAQRRLARVLPKTRSTSLDAFIQLARNLLKPA
jgi:hypothetical protein